MNNPFSLQTIHLHFYAYRVGCGFAMHGAPAYIGEMAPSQIRGLLVSFKEVFIVLGMLFGYSIGYAYSYSEGGWRWVYWWSTPLAIIMMIGEFHIFIKEFVHK